MKPTNTFGQLLCLPGYIVDGIAYNLAGLMFTSRPRFVCFPVTFRCNSRCQMCNIWQHPNTTKELDLTKIQEVFSNALFNKVEEVVLHGGEPTLRKDLKDIYRIVTESCPSLKHITSSTNGINPSLVKKRIGEVLSAVNSDTVQLTFSVSIDGLRKSHEKIRGIEGGFDRAIESLEVLKKYQRDYQIEVVVITVIQPQNLQDLENMEELAKQHDVGIIFQPLMIDTFYNNSTTDTRLRFSEDQYRELREFIRTRLIRTADTKSLYWRNFLEMMAGRERTVPCAYDRYVLSLYPTGEVLPCSKEDWIRFGNVHEKPVDQLWFSRDSKTIRKRMRKQVCPTCTFYCGAEYSLRKEFFTYSSYLLKTGLRSLFGIPDSPP